MLRLRWENINWELERFTVTVGKTKTRIVPLFPELRDILSAAFDAAPVGAEFVIDGYRDANSNLRTQVFRLLTRAGVAAWPRLFHNLRASRQTELEDKYPSHVVCNWMGNSESVASRHYLQVTEDHFSMATAKDESAEQNVGCRGRNLAESVPNSGPRCSPEVPENSTNAYIAAFASLDGVPPRGNQTTMLNAGIYTGF